MATEAEIIPEPISILKTEEESKHLTLELCDKAVEFLPGDLKKFESGFIQPAETDECLAKAENMEVASNTVSEVNLEISKGESFLISPEISMVANETSGISEHIKVDGTFKAEKIPEDEEKMAIDKKIQLEEEVGTGENEVKEATEETNHLQENEETRTDENADIESNTNLELKKQASVDTPDPIVDSLKEANETVTEASNSNLVKEVKDTESEPEKLPALVGKEEVSEAIELTVTSGSEKDQIISDSIGNTLTSTVAESSEIKDHETTSMVVESEEVACMHEPAPEVDEKLEEISSIIIKDKSQATRESSEEIKCITGENDGIQDEKTDQDFGMSSELCKSYANSESEKVGEDAKVVQATDKELAKTEESDEMKRDEESTVPMPEGKISEVENIPILKESFQQKNEPEKDKPACQLNVVYEDVNTAISGENAETSTSIKELTSVKDHEERFEGEEKEDTPTNTDAVSENGESKEKDYLQIEVNEKTETVEVEISNKNADDLHVTDSLVGQPVENEQEKQYEFSNVQPEEQVHEAISASKEKEEDSEDVSEAWQSGDSTNLIFIEAAAAATDLKSETSEMDKENVKHCAAEKPELKDAMENIEDNLKQEKAKEVCEGPKSIDDSLKCTEEDEKEETPEVEVCEKLETDNTVENAEKQILEEEDTNKDQTTLLTETVKEKSKENTAAMMSIKEKIEDDSKAENNFEVSTSATDKEESEPDIEVCKESETAASGTAKEDPDMEEHPIADISNSSISDETVKENIKEGESSPMKLTEEASNSNIEETTKPNNDDPSPFDIVKESKEEIKPIDVKEELVHSSSFELEESKKDTEEETSVKRSVNTADLDSASCAAEIEETNITEVEAEEEKTEINNVLAVEENDLATTEHEGIGVDSAEIDVKSVDSSITCEKDMEIPQEEDGMQDKIPNAGSEDQMEMTTKEIPLKEILGDEVKEHYIMPSAEYEATLIEERKITDETSEKDQAPYEHSETPMSQATDEILMQNEDNSTLDVPKAEPEDTGKESGHEVEEHLAEEPNVHTEQEPGKCSSVSDVTNVSNGEKPRELDNQNDACEAKTMQDEQSSDLGLEREKIEDGKPLDEATDFGETLGTCKDGEKAIEEEENLDNLAKPESLKEDAEIGKEDTELPRGAHDQIPEVVNVNDNVKNVELALEGFEEKPKSDPEPVAEDQSNQTFPEPSKSQDDETSTDEQIKKELKDKLEDEDYINGEENANEVTKAVILSEEVDTEVEKADGSEDIEEHVMEEESSTDELHQVSKGDETTNEVEDYSSVSTECLKEADSKEQIEAENSEVEEHSTIDREASHVIKELDERRQDEESGDPESESSEDREAEEKIEEIIDDSKLSHDENHIEAVTEERAETSLNDTEVNGEPVNTSNISSLKMSLKTIENEANQETKEVENVKLEEISSDLAPQIPSNDNDEVEKQNLNMETVNKDAAEIIKRDPDAFYKPKDQIAEAEEGRTVEKVDQLNSDHELVETKSEASKTSNPDELGKIELASDGDHVSEDKGTEQDAETKKSQTAELEANKVEETKGVPEISSDYISQRAETISSPSSLPEDKPQEQLQTSAGTLLSEDEEIRTAHPIEKIEEEIQKDAETKHESLEDSSDTKIIEEVCFPNEEQKELKAVSQEETSADQGVPNNEPEEQIQTTSSTLPSEEREHGTGAISEEIEYGKTKEEVPTKLDAVTGDEIAGEQTLSANKPEEGTTSCPLVSKEKEEENISTVEKTEEEKINEADIPDKISEDSSDAKKTAEICLEKEEFQELDDAKKDETVAAQALQVEEPNEQSLTSELPAENIEPTAKEEEEEKVKEVEMLEKEMCLEKEGPQEPEAVVDQETIVAQASITEESLEIETIGIVEKLDEEKRKEAEKLEDENCEDSSAGETKEICLQKEEKNELHSVPKEEITSGQIFSEEQLHISISAIASEELEHETKETEDEKTNEGEILKDEIEEDASDARTTVERCSQRERSVELEAVVEDEMTAGHTLTENKSQEQVQNPTSALPSKEEECGNTSTAEKIESEITEEAEFLQDDNGEDATLQKERLQEDEALAVEDNASAQTISTEKPEEQIPSPVVTLPSEEHKHEIINKVDKTEEEKVKEEEMKIGDSDGGKTVKEISSEKDETREFQAVLEGETNTCQVISEESKEHGTVTEEEEEETLEDEKSPQSECPRELQGALQDGATAAHTLPGETPTDDLHITTSTLPSEVQGDETKETELQEDESPEKIPEQTREIEEASNFNMETHEKAFDNELLAETGDAAIKEKLVKGRDETGGEENQCEKTNEGNEIILNEVSKEEVMEGKEVTETSYSTSHSEELTKDGSREDELKDELIDDRTYEELIVEAQKISEDVIIEKQVEDKTVEDPGQASVARIETTTATKEKAELALAGFQEKSKFDSEPVAEDQSKETFPEPSKSQDDETSTDVQNQETDEQIKEELKDKLEDEDYVNKEENANEVTEDVILSEEVDKEVEKADNGEDIKEHVMEEEISTNELHPVSKGDETTNEVEDYSSVSTECLKEADSKEQIEEENAEVEEHSTTDREASHVIKELEERRQDEESEDPVSMHGEDREAEEKIEEIIEDSKLCHDESHIEAVTEVRGETSLNETEVNEELVNTSTISSVKMSLETIESDGNQETKVENVQLEEISSDLAPQVPTNDNDEVEKQSLNMETVDKDEAEVIKRDPDEPEVCLPNEEQRELKAVSEEETVADRGLPSDEPEEQIQTISSTLPSEEMEHGTGAISEEIEYGKIKEEVPTKPDVVTGDKIIGEQTLSANKPEGTTSSPLVSKEKEEENISMVEKTEEEKINEADIPDKILENSSDAMKTAEICLEKEEFQEVDDAKKDEIAAAQALQVEESNEQSLTSELPAENMEHGATANEEEEEKVKEVEILEKEMCLEKEGPQEPEAVVDQETIVAQASIIEESLEIETIGTVEKLDEEKRKEAEKPEEENCEDSSAGETEEICLQKEEPNELHLVPKEEFTSGQTLSEEQLHISTSAITSEELEHETRETEDEKTNEGEIINQEDASDARRTVETCSQKERSVQLEAVVEDEMTAGHTLTEKKSEEQVQNPTSALPSKEEECGSTSTAEKTESEKTEEAEFLQDDNGEDASLQKEQLQEDEALAVDDNASAQTIPTEKPEEQIPNSVVTLPLEEHKHETINEVDKTEEEKVKEEEMKNGDSDGGKTVEEISSEKDETREFQAVLEGETNTCQVISEESKEHGTVTEEEEEETLEDEKSPQSECPRELQGALQDGATAAHTLPGETPTDHLHITTSTLPSEVQGDETKEMELQEDESPEKIPEQTREIEEASNFNMETHEKAFDNELLAETGDAAIKEKLVKGRDETGGKENQCEKTNEGNEIILNEVSKEEVMDGKEVTETSYPTSHSEELTKDGYREDELKDQLIDDKTYEELIVEAQKISEDVIIEKQVEDKTVEDPGQASVARIETTTATKEESSTELSAAEGNQIIDDIQQPKETTNIAYDEHIPRELDPIENTGITSSISKEHVPIDLEDRVAESSQKAEVGDLKEIYPEVVEHGGKKTTYNSGEEIIEESTSVEDSTKISSSDHVESSTKETLQVTQDLIEEREAKDETNASQILLVEKTEEQSPAPSSKFPFEEGEHGVTTQVDAVEEKELKEVETLDKDSSDTETGGEICLEKEENKELEAVAEQETIAVQVPSTEIKEEPVFHFEDSSKEDELKDEHIRDKTNETLKIPTYEIQNEKFSVETVKDGANNSIEKEIITEDQTAKELEQAEEEKKEINNVLAVEEIGLATTEHEGTGVDSADIDVKTVGSSITCEKDMEIPQEEDGMQDKIPNAGSEDQMEMTTKEIPLKEILGDEVKEHSTMPSEEYEATLNEERKITVENSEKDQAPYEQSETPVSQATDEILMQNEDNSTLDVPKAEPEDTGKESGHEVKEHLAEEPNVHTEQESGKCSSVSEVTNGEEPRELDNETDACEAKTLQDEQSSDFGLEREKIEDGKPLDEATDFGETLGTCKDDEKPIEEEENLAKNLAKPESLKEDTEIGKEDTELPRGAHDQIPEVVNVKDNAKNVELALAGFEEKPKSDPEPVAEDQSKETFPEPSKSQADETSTDVQNQETEEQIKEELKDKLEDEDYANREENANEVNEDVILSEEVDKEVEKADDSEDIKEHVKEEEISRNELHPVSKEDETTNEVEDYSSVSTECLKEADSKEQIEAENSEVEEHSTNGREASHVTKELEEKRQNEESGDRVSVRSEDREAEEKTEEITVDSKLCHDESHIEAVTEVRAETSLNDTEVNEEPVNTSNISSVKMSLEAIENEAKQETKEVQNLKLEEISSDLAPQVPSNDNDEVEKQNLNMETVDKDEPEVIKRDPDEPEVCLRNEEQKELKAVSEEETIADQGLPNDEQEDQIQTTSPTLPSEEREHGTGAISEEIEYGKTKDEVLTKLDAVTGDEITGEQTLSANKPEEGTTSCRLVSKKKEEENISAVEKTEEKINEAGIPDKISEDSSDAKRTVEICLEKEEFQELDDAKKDETAAAQALQVEESNEQSLTSELPAENIEPVANEEEEEEKVKEVEMLEKEMCLEKEGPQKPEAVVDQETIVAQASITEESLEIGTIGTVEKLDEEKRIEAEKPEAENCEDSSAGETEEICLQKEEPNELHSVPNEEIASGQTFSEEQLHISTSTITSEELEHETKETEDEKTNEREILKDEIEEEASDARTIVEICSQMERSVELEAVVEDKMTAGHTLTEKKSEEQVQNPTSSLPSKEEECGSTSKDKKIESEKTEEAEFLQDDDGEDATLQKERLQEDEALAIDDNASAQTIPTEKPEEQIPNPVVTLQSEEHKHETNNEVDKTEEEKVKEEEMKNGDSDGGKTVERISSEMDETRESQAVLEGENTSLVISEESQEHGTVTEETLEDEKSPQPECGRELQGALEDGATAAHTLPGETPADHLHITTSTSPSEVQGGEMKETELQDDESPEQAREIQEASNFNTETHEKAFDNELLAETEYAAIKEKLVKARDETGGEENQCDKTNEGNEIILNEVAKEEVMEDKEVTETSYSTSQSEELTKDGSGEDELKDKLIDDKTYKELILEAQKTSEKGIIEKQIGDKTVEDPGQASVARIETTTVTEENVELALASFQEKSKSNSEPVAEDQSKETFPEPSKSQDDETRTDVQNKKTEEQIKEELKGNLEDEDYIKSEENANEVTKAVILSEEVDTEIEKLDGSQDIEEHVKEEESSTNELHQVSKGDETTNEVEDYSSVSTECLKEADSKEQIEAENSEVEEHSTNDRDASHVIKELEERRQDEESGDPVSMHGEDREAEEKIEKTEEEKINEAGIPDNISEDSSDPKKTAEICLEKKEFQELDETAAAQALQVEKSNEQSLTSELPAEYIEPTANEEEEEKVKEVEMLEEEMCLEKEGPQEPEAVVDQETIVAQASIIEESLEIEAIGTVEKLDEEKRKDAKKLEDENCEDSSAGQTEEICLQKEEPNELHLVPKEEITSGQTFSEEQLRISTSAITSGELEHETKETEDENTNESEIINDEIEEDASDARTTVEICSQKERSVELEAVVENEMTAGHTLTEKKSEEQVQNPTSALPSKEEECGSTSTAKKIQSEKTEEAEFLQDDNGEDAPLQKERLQEDEALAVDDNAFAQTIPTEKPEEQIPNPVVTLPSEEHKHESNNEVDKTEEEKVKEEEMKNADCDGGKTVEEISSEKDETREPQAVLEGETNTSLVISEESQEHGTVTEEKKIKEEETLEDEKSPQSECPRELQGALEDGATAAHTLPGETPINHLHITTSILPSEVHGDETKETEMQEDESPEKIPEQTREIEEASNFNMETHEKAFDNELLAETEDAAIKEKLDKGRDKIGDEENQCEKTNEGNEIILNDISKEEVMKDKEVTETSYSTSHSEELTKAGSGEDELQDKLIEDKAYEELNVEAQKTIEKQIEDKTVEDRGQASIARIETTTATKEESSTELSATEGNQIIDDIQQPEETTNIASDEQIPRELDPIENTGITSSIAKEHVPIDLQDRVAESSQKAEVGDVKKIYPEVVEHGGEKTADNSGEEMTEESTSVEDSTKISSSDHVENSAKETLQVTQDMIGEREAKDETNASQIPLVEKPEKQYPAPSSKLPSGEGKHGVTTQVDAVEEKELKEVETLDKDSSDTKTGGEIHLEKGENKELKAAVEQETIAVQAPPTEIKEDPVSHFEDGSKEDELKDEHTRGKTNETLKIPTYEIQNEKLSVETLKDGANNNIEKEIVAEDETVKDLEQAPVDMKEAIILREEIPGEDPIESRKTISIGKEHFPTEQQDRALEISDKAEVGDLEPGNAQEICSEAGVDHGKERKTDNSGVEITQEPEPADSAKLSLSDLLQRSTREKIQVTKDVIEERELIVSKEEPPVEVAKTDEEKDDGEEGDEHSKTESGSDAPVMVEAPRDTDTKPHKKSHNILSGVGLRVKHSISKVKKAITGKSSHSKESKSISPKESKK